MVNPEKIEGLLEKLQTYVKQLNELKKLSNKELTGKFTNLNSAKYLFQIAIECCLDIGNHIISSEGYRSPVNYKDIFKVLNENKILPDRFTETALSMAKFRNRLVHLYFEIDDINLYKYLQENLKYFDEYVKYILAFLKKNK
ncbi:MAG: DUF86 domain-containing protein [Candidatus Margulisbacteria bacterium]|nr:DUF86 domain-containing protein [Candidatus Margulisiibacteriota bacterium]MBU1022028.1 DUF86 domain-containing protein [Candidatus Margulisiibacteriota bacterium]MBU1729623.1 DUF86 domain-containing protein [Candidatus Margulisiibacteriota bacterium]MBU1954943.1 DUF86 domain-containing protein [Candidatus Margulisiibacteriota bacterium]